MKLSKIFATTLKRPCFTGLDAVTVPTINKTYMPYVEDADGNPIKQKRIPNPHYGRITKVMTGALVLVNADYQNAVNRQYEKLGLPADFVSKGLPYGEWLENGSPVIVHKNMMQLRTHVLHGGKVHYLCDGKKIDERAIIGMKESKGRTISADEIATKRAAMTADERAKADATIAANIALINEAKTNPSSVEIPAAIRAIVEDSALFIRNFKGESLTAVRMNHTEYTTIDSAA